MSTLPTHNVTRLLQAWSAGDPHAAEQLLPLIYDHLRELAQRYMGRERDGHTLQPTALVHEAYLRLADGANVSYQGRTHFYHVAARAMRRILVDHARARQAQRRGGAQTPLPLSEIDAAEPPAEIGATDLVALNDALDRLAKDYPRPSQVVELRFFGGMTAQDIAEALQVTDRTIKRDWQFARLWLHRELAASQSPA